MKVSVTPFQINQPHQHSASGRSLVGSSWPYSKVRLNAAAPPHVDVNAGGRQYPPGAPQQWEDGGMPAEVLHRTQQPLGHHYLRSASEPWVWEVAKLKNGCGGPDLYFRQRG